MFLLRLLSLLLISLPTWAADYFLTISEIDTTRERATINMDNPEATVPLGTVLRVHGKHGTCSVRILERVNSQLLAATPDCDAGIIKPGMRLAYSNDVNDWPEEGKFISGDTSSPTDQFKDFMGKLRGRLSVYLGHNFSSNLEGKVRADGSFKDLSGNSAFTLGVMGNVYNFTPQISLHAGIGHEFNRTFDEAKFVQNGTEFSAGSSTFNYLAPNSPELSIWSLVVQGEFKALDKLTAFGGLNYSLPDISRVPWTTSGDIGFQVGANYEVYKNIAVESLIKITNINLTNDIGETTDVSLSGLELRGRYNF